MTPSGCLFQIIEGSLLVIINCLSRAMKDGQRPIRIPMDLHFDPYAMVSIPIRGDLKFHSLEADTVVGADRPFFLFAENVIKIISFPGNRKHHNRR